jgi:16S rRNA (adenine(1408)-N(1))-methyltransferase
MKILSGKRQKELKSEELNERIRGRYPVHIDVGTGSGRLVLKHSAIDPGGFYIGIDPSAESMVENAVKAAKRLNKTAPDNLLFVIGSIEFVPDELTGIADVVSVILPWGSLRDGIVKGDLRVLSNLRRLGRPGSTLEIFVGYDGKIEPCVLEKRALPILSRDYMHALAPAYRNAGIAFRSIETVGNDGLKAVESDWAKKLAYGRQRVIYRLDGVYV